MSSNNTCMSSISSSVRMSGGNFLGLCRASRFLLLWLSFLSADEVFPIMRTLWLYDFLATLEKKEIITSSSLQLSRYRFTYLCPRTFWAKIFVILGNFFGAEKKCIFPSVVLFFLAFILHKLRGQIYPWDNAGIIFPPGKILKKWLLRCFFVAKSSAYFLSC